MTDRSASESVPAWAEDILHCWFDHVGPARWFDPDPELDEELRARFAPLRDALRDERPEAFLASPRLALAAVILFDQLPRNMCRGEADAFGTDPLARDIAEAALARRQDRQLDPQRRQFLYMPFMHSEAMADQDRSVALFDALATETGDHAPLRFAILHRELIARWGRFPHRNELLGRDMRPGEAEAASQGADW